MNHLDQVQTVLLGLALIGAAAIGSFLTWLGMTGWARRAERRGERKAWKELEKLQRSRAIQDHRDNQRAF